MYQILCSIWILASCCALAVAQDGSGNIDSATERQIAEVLSAWERTQVKLAEGEMEFKIQQHKSDEELDLVGIVGWRFPNIRWEFTQTTTTNNGETQSSYIIIDTPREIITHNLTSRQAFRSWGRDRTYDRVLRLAPWQCWFEFDGQVSWSDVLSTEKLKSTAERTVSAKTSGDKVTISLSTIEATLRVTFDKNTGCQLGYAPTPNFGFEMHQKLGKFQWTQVEHVPFPTLIELSRLGPDEKPDSKLNTKVETSGHRLSTRWKKEDFSYAALDKSSIDRMTEIFAGDRAPKLHIYRKENLNEAETMQKLGEKISNMGFARGPR